LMGGHAPTFYCWPYVIVTYSLMERWPLSYKHDPRATRNVCLYVRLGTLS
jgi:hypothetical protein